MKILGSLLMACFLTAVSNAELRTWTAVNGKQVKANFVSSTNGIVKLRLESGKIFEVPNNKLSKKDNEFIAGLYEAEVIGSGIKKVTKRSNKSEKFIPYRKMLDEFKEEFKDKKFKRVREQKLVNRVNTFYETNSQEPFTGISYKNWPNGQLMREYIVINGKYHGVEKSFSENGDLQGERVWKDGKPIYLKFWYTLEDVVNCNPEPHKLMVQSETVYLVESGYLVNWKKDFRQVYDIRGLAVQDDDIARVRNKKYQNEMEEMQIQVGRKNKNINELEKQTPKNDSTVSELEKNTPKRVSTLNFTDGLVAYYPFNGNANDESKNDNNGKVNGATLTTDRNGNTNSAYSFDGLDDFIEIKNSPQLNFDNEMSISFWLNPNSWEEGNNTAGIISKMSDSLPDDGYVIHHDFNRRGKINFRSLGDDYHTTNSVLSLRAWSHWSLTYNKGIIRWFKNGIKDSEYSTILNESDLSNSLPLFIGFTKRWLSWRFPSYYSGSIDDIRFYNRALSSSEVSKLYELESVRGGIKTKP